MVQLTALRKAKSEKRAARTAAKAAKVTTPKSFEERISQADAIQARGMSIKLGD